MNQGVLAAAANLPVVGGFVGVGSEITSLASGLFGGGGGATDAARKARVDSYVLGVQHGSVLAGRYLLSGLSTQGAHAEHALYVNAVNMLNGDPVTAAIMQQAQTAGPVPDEGDGRGGLEVLAQLGIPFNEPGAGHNTANGDILSQDVANLASQLRLITGNAINQARAAVSGTVNTVGSQITTGTANAIAPGSGNVSVPTNIGTLILFGLGVLALLFVFFRHK
jgi:hypothetical protein